MVSVGCAVIGYKEQRKYNIPIPNTSTKQGWAIPGFGQQYYTQYYTAQKYAKLYNTLYQYYTKSN